MEFHRVVPIPDSELFASSSSDGCVRIWDAGRMESKSQVNRSRQAYTRQGGSIIALTTVPQEGALVSASDNGSIHVFRYIHTSSS